MEHLIRKASSEFKLFESNAIAKYGIMTMASKTLGPLQYKALMYLLWSNLQQRPGRIGIVAISLSELCYALGYSKDENYNFTHQMKKVAGLIDDLMSQKLRIYDESKHASISFVWIQTAVIVEQEDSVLVHFNSDLSRYFGQELKKEFTVVKLKYLNRLTSPSSVILYPFFCRYRNMASTNYSIRELAELLTGNPDYEYKYLKRDYLIPGIQAINNLTDLKVVMSENKKGRKTSSLKFIISESPGLKELEVYMDTANVKSDELNVCPYNDDWMKDYDYDMSEQTYIPHSKEDEEDYAI